MNIPENIAKLMVFYSVDNEWDLINAMDWHIDKLQLKLKEATILDVVRRVVREG